MEIRLTQAASAMVRLLVGQDGRPGAGLRIALEPGGCCGLFYYMVVDVPRRGDAVVDAGGVRLLLSPAAARCLDGARLDYSDRLKPPRFRVQNPQAPDRCPCGRSFGSPWRGRSPDCRAYEPPPWLL